jgi:RND family efflux transporter MFP subunit
VKVTIGNSGKNTYDGQVIVIDNQVDPLIAAVRVKAQIPNDKLEILPGQFARVSLNANTLKDVIAVPTQAVVIGPNGKLVYVVDKDDKVTAKPVKVSYEYLGTSVITGINSGDRIVVEGKQNLRNGSKVREAKTPKSDPAPANKTPPTEQK